jgi:hypothetical protein
MVIVLNESLGISRTCFRAELAANTSKFRIRFDRERKRELRVEPHRSLLVALVVLMVVWIQLIRTVFVIVFFLVLSGSPSLRPISGTTRNLIFPTQV